jgi:hypothetical protein
MNKTDREFLAPASVPLGHLANVQATDMQPPAAAQPHSLSTPAGSNRPTVRTASSERESIRQILLQKVKSDGTLPFGTFARIARGYGVSPQAVAFHWEHIKCEHPQRALRAPSEAIKYRSAVGESIEESLLREDQSNGQG